MLRSAPEAAAVPAEADSADEAFFSVSSVMSHRQMCVSSPTEPNR